MGLFSNFVVAIAEAIRDKDGQKLRQLLDLNNNTAREAVFERCYARTNWNPAPDVHDALRSLYDANGSWQDIVTAHCRALACLTQGKTEEAYVHVESSVLPFTKEYREDKAAWLGAPLEGLAQSLRLVALAADADSRKAGKKGGALENCGGSLQRIYACAASGGNSKKKAPVLGIVVTLLRIYFRLNNVGLCKTLKKAVDRLDFEMFPASSRVTYMFFLGRLAIFDDKYEEAEQALEYALRHCHRAAISNKSRILYFLVPVKMLLGQLPAQAALQRYRLEEYADIVDALRTGSVKKLNASLEAQQWRFIRAGTYLVLEKLKQAVMRRLLKRVSLLHAEANPSRPNQLPLGVLQQALQWQDMPLEMDEVECLVANLIYRGYVKGYISHSKRILVLSKVAPFPHLKSVNMSDLF